jgi:uncharacterized protein (DUF362 family)/Pyruvate/2-oxoacid:ferredoxin oxidoreductase delta subunit
VDNVSKHKTIFLNHTNYNFDELHQNITVLLEKSKLFEELEEKKVKSILLKQNLLGIYPSENGSITHPTFVEVIAKIFFNNGYEVGIGDSSASFFRMEKLYKENGYDSIFRNKYAKKENFEFEPFLEIALNNDKIKSIKIAGAFEKYDYYISLPKLKTHNISIITCALKNFYGIIPGVGKSHYHHIFHKLKDFNRFLVDIYEACRADFYIVDGILGMEGDGPSGGDPRYFNLLIAGRNGLKIDGYLLKMMGIDANQLDYFIYATKKNLYDEIQEEDFLLPFEYNAAFEDFKLPISVLLGQITNILPKFLFSFLRLYPAVDRKKCTLCKSCIKKCPQKALTAMKTRIKIDKHLCIACGCCKEVCQAEAIHMQGSTLMKIFESIRRLYENLRRKKRT